MPAPRFAARSGTSTARPPPSMTAAVKTVRIITSDGEEFEMDRKSANCSTRLKNILGKRNAQTKNDPIHLAEINAPNFRRIKEWCDHHKRDAHQLAETVEAARGMMIPEWDANFLGTDQEVLSDILITAHSLDIKPLVQLGCRTVADQLRGVPLEQLRKMANVPSDIPQEEQAQMRREIMRSWDTKYKV